MTISVILVVGGWWIYSICKDNHRLKSDNALLSEQILAQQIVFTTYLKLTAVIHEVSQTNVREREQTVDDATEAKTVIKTIFVANDCAVASVPDGYIDELRRFQEGEVRVVNDSTNPVSSDR